MGAEYKITVPSRMRSVVNLENFKKFKSFWKTDEIYDNYFLGRMLNSDFPEIMIWTREGALGVTVSGGDSHAWNELHSFVRHLKDVCPDLEITDWDSGDDVSDAFLVPS